MTFLEHLGELRTRILHALLGWLACSVAMWFLAPTIIDILVRLIGNTQLVFLHPTEAFFVFFKIALFGGLFVDLPWILVQVALFVAPGLERQEKRWLWRIVPSAWVLFLCGSLFAYFVLLPTALHFFLGFQQYFHVTNVQTTLSFSSYIGFVLMLTLVCGLVFEIPIVIMVLAVAGVVNSALLRKGRRYAILIMFIVSGIVTPTPDAFTQTIVAVPMIVLYEISIWVVRGMGK